MAIPLDAPTDVTVTVDAFGRPTTTGVLDGRTLFCRQGWCPRCRDRSVLYWAGLPYGPDCAPLCADCEATPLPPRADMSWYRHMFREAREDPR